MGKILQFFYTVWALMVFHVFMILLFPWFFIPPLIHKQKGLKITFRAIRLWSYLFSFFNFIHYKIKGQENIVKGKNYVFVVNHTSFLDTPALPQAIDGVFRPLAKKELVKIPLFGLLIKLVTVVVDRSSPESRQKSKDVLNYVLNEESSIVVFPEGTMNRKNIQLQDFYSGAFRIAIDAQTEIIPIVVKGASKLMKPSSLLMAPGKIRISILPSISTTGLVTKDIDKLKENVREKMIKELNID